MGFSPDEATIFRAIIRWHRTRKPRATDRYVGRMSDSELNIATWLTAILRVADGADSGKSSVVDDIIVSVNPDVVFLRVKTHQDSELEMYSARRKRQLLEVISGRDVVIELAHQPEVG
jgi:exopolyphosphatase/guanosine-5'-triphosphate,3'-diphosphate pyrophosphatase